MRTFECRRCGNLLAFENTACVVCGAEQGFSPDDMSLLPLAGTTARLCATASFTGCNWLVTDDTQFCASCRLTRTRPQDDDRQGMGAFATAEAAKRRLVYQLMDLRLPITATQDDPRGLAFDLLSSTDEPVTTGHADGVVTIDLAEGHDPHREAMRVQMGEPYRTMLGHLRHEVGHYYFQVLVERSSAEVLTQFRNLFGDERADYGQALERHYAEGAPEGWQVTHISAYAMAHPWEDWAETFAHYLHILDTLQTAAAWGVAVTGPAASADAQTHPGDEERGSAGIHSIVATWLPLTYALNAMNRSMGKDDLYPFILTESVIAKLDFVHRLVVGNAPDILAGTG